jgi:hypothetical protein
MRWCEGGHGCAAGVGMRLPGSRASAAAAARGQDMHPIRPCGNYAGDHPARVGEFQASVSLAWATSGWLESQRPQASVHDPGAERASGTGNHTFGDGWAMLRAEILARPDNRGRDPGEPFEECSVVSRSIIGSLGQAGGNRHWCYDNGADVLPELTLIFHLPFLLALSIAETICIGRQLYGTSGKSASDCGWIYSFTASSCPPMRGRARGLVPTSMGDLGLPSADPARRSRRGCLPGSWRGSRHVSYFVA